MELDDVYDFGFSTHSEEEIQQTGKALVDDKAQKMYDAIIPLLNNLAKDADKNSYIHWPQRAEKIKGFKKHLEAILKS